MKLAITFICISIVNMIVGAVFLKRYNDVMAEREHGKEFVDKALERLKKGEK